MKDILELFSGKENFCIVGYSFGALLALEITKILESKGKKGTLKIIDGSPQFISTLSNLFVPVVNDDNIQSLILLTCARILFPDDFHEVAKNIFSHSTWETRLDNFVQVAQARSQYSADYGSKMLTALVNRLKISLTADKLTLPILSSTPLSLIRSSDSSAQNLGDDYGLAKYSTSKVNVNVIDGNHTTMLSNPDLIRLLNI